MFNFANFSRTNKNLLRQQRNENYQKNYIKFPKLFYSVKMKKKNSDSPMPGVSRSISLTVLIANFLSRGSKWPFPSYRLRASDDVEWPRDGSHIYSQYSDMVLIVRKTSSSGYTAEK